jgi:hypothetical protein
MRRRKAPLALLVLALIGTMTLGLAATVTADGNRIELRARMNGAQEVPPTDPDGRGPAVVVLRPNRNLICFTLHYTKIGAPNRGHIHSGVAGANGGIVVTLFDLVDPPAVPSDPLYDQLELNRIHRCVMATRETIQAIADNPAGYYVNLHNQRFPGGVIRGLLFRD